MSPEEPIELKNWKRERVLGTGGFGTVTLWKQKNGDQMIGNCELSSSSSLQSNFNFNAVLLSLALYYLHSLRLFFMLP